MIELEVTPMPCVLEDGETQTLAVNVGFKTIVGMIIPASFEGVTLTFHVAPRPGDTYQPLYDSAGNAVSFTVASNRQIWVPAEVFGGVKNLKITSNTAADGADREITLLAKHRD